MKKTFKSYICKAVTTIACATLMFAGALGLNSISAKAATTNWTIDLRNGRNISLNYSDMHEYSISNEYKDYVATEVVLLLYNPNSLNSTTNQITSVLSNSPFQGISCTELSRPNPTVNIKALDGSIGTGKYIISKDVIKQRASADNSSASDSEVAEILFILNAVFTGDISFPDNSKPEDYLDLVFEIEFKYSDDPVITNNRINAASLVAFEAGKELENNGIKYRIADAAGNLSAIGLTSSPKTVTVPDVVNFAGFNLNVTDVAANFMKGNKKTKTVTIGSNVTTIGKQAFYNCKKLKKVTIKSKKIKSFGVKAFGKNAEKFTLKLPKSCKKSYKKLLKKAKIKF